MRLEGRGIAPAEAMPDGPVLLNHIRLQLGPGADVPLDPDPKERAFLSVESGEITVSANTPLVISRRERGSVLTPVDNAANTDFSLGPTESFALPVSVAATITNRGQESAVLVVTTIRSDAPPASADTASPVATL